MWVSGLSISYPFTQSTQLVSIEYHMNYDINFYNMADFEAFLYRQQANPPIKCISGLFSLYKKNLICWFSQSYRGGYDAHLAFWWPYYCYSCLNLRTKLNKTLQVYIILLYGHQRYKILPYFCKSVTSVYIDIRHYKSNACLRANVLLFFLFF